ncbi:hypothetical protein RCH14_003795 [Massilia sp. MP_M2]|uniref:hypothetical protein n=1 Tax=Massilia sp. MP_M2 TaxID=3071713 RepID=UPI00319E4B5E
MDLSDFTNQIKNFNDLAITEKISIIGYFLHAHRNCEKFKAAEINNCFDALHIKRPANTGSQMTAMAQNARLLGNTSGFRLSNTTRARVVAILPSTAPPKQILSQLKKLEESLTDPQQQTFLHEANVCFINGAYRAAVVMAWNLAYHHVCRKIFDQHLDDYNSRLPSQYKNEKPIVKFTDFEDSKESIVIAVAKGAGIISNTTAKILKAKLDIRNIACHPSSTTILPITAEEVISDLAHNILLKPAL